MRVLTADDVPGLNDAGEKHDEPLFPSEVMFYGHAVVWVLGETQEAARQGADKIEVEYEPLPSIINVREAIEAEQLPGPQAHGVSWRRGCGAEVGRADVQGRARVRRPGALLPGDQRCAGAGR